jgi:hypothetical protein
VIDPVCHPLLQESSHAEERLRALFVASDIDGDGNLDFQVCTTVCMNAHVDCTCSPECMHSSTPRLYVLT